MYEWTGATVAEGCAAASGVSVADGGGAENAGDGAGLAFHEAVVREAGNLPDKITGVGRMTGLERRFFSGKR
jgi:hypothetical protein